LAGKNHFFLPGSAEVLIAQYAPTYPRTGRSRVCYGYEGKCPMTGYVLSAFPDVDFRKKF